LVCARYAAVVQQLIYANPHYNRHATANGFPLLFLQLKMTIKNGVVLPR